MTGKVLKFSYYLYCSKLLARSHPNSDTPQERENDDYLLLFSFKGKILRN